MCLETLKELIMIGVQDYDQIEHFSNGAFLKWSNSQIEHFSNGAFLGRHHQLDDSLVGQLTRPNGVFFDNFFTGGEQSTKYTWLGGRSSRLD